MFVLSIFTSFEAGAAAGVAAGFGLEAQPSRTEAASAQLIRVRIKGFLETRFREKAAAEAPRAAGIRPYRY
jgi:hypothetical protein